MAAANARPTPRVIFDVALFEHGPGSREVVVLPAIHLRPAGTRRYEQEHVQEWEYEQEGGSLRLLAFVLLVLVCAPRIAVGIRFTRAHARTRLCSQNRRISRRSSPLKPRASTYNKYRFSVFVAFRSNGF